jgi:protein SCO1/2
MRPAFALAAVLLLLVACSRTETTTKPLSERGEKLYSLKGKILGRDAADNSLRLDHEAIPGFMEAMTMDYPVRGAKVQELPPDKSKIVARLHVNDDKVWITDVKRAP